MKDNWIIFFQDVEASLQRVKDVWLEDLRVDRTENKSYVQSEDSDKPTLVVQKEQKVKLSGRMLLRVGDEDGSSGKITEDLILQRIIQLKDGIEDSEFVQPGATYEIFYKDFDEGLNILRFTFDLTINPDKPLWGYLLSYEEGQAQSNINWFIYIDRYSIWYPGDAEIR